MMRTIRKDAKIGQLMKTLHQKMEVGVIYGRKEVERLITKHYTSPSFVMTNLIRANIISPTGNSGEAFVRTSSMKEEMAVNAYRKAQSGGAKKSRATKKRKMYRGQLTSVQLYAAADNLLAQEKVIRDAADHMAKVEGALKALDSGRIR